MGRMGKRPQCVDWGTGSKGQQDGGKTTVMGKGRNG